MPVIVFTAQGSSQAAIEAMQLGAYDYVPKPFDLDELALTIRRLFEHQDLKDEVHELKEQLRFDPSDRMIGRSPSMVEIFKTIGRIARSDATVLVMGETGTGKELVAEQIHRASNRRGGPHDPGGLRHPPGDAPGERAVRAREGGLHQRHHPAQGALRAGPQGHHLPGRDRGDDAQHAAQAAARAAGAGVRAGGGQRPHQGGRAGDRGHQQVAPGRGGQGELPGGPLLPPQRGDHRGAPPARPAPRGPQPGRRAQPGLPLPGQVPLRERPARRPGSPRRRWRRCWRTTSRATCASWRT